MLFRTGQQAKTDPIDDFINSLDYWENINLRIALIRNTNHEVSDQDAYDRAILDFKESESLKLQLEKVLRTGIPN